MKDADILSLVNFSTLRHSHRSRVLISQSQVRVRVRVTKKPLSILNHLDHSRVKPEEEMEGQDLQVLIVKTDLLPLCRMHLSVLALRVLKINLDCLPAQPVPWGEFFLPGTKKCKTVVAVRVRGIQEEASSDPQQSCHGRAKRLTSQETGSR